MKIKKIYHYSNGDKAVWEYNNKVIFSKEEYDALILEEEPFSTGVQTTELCDYLKTANVRENKGDTFHAVLDRYRNHKYTSEKYETTLNNVNVHGEVIYEDGKAVVMSAITQDKILHTLNFWRPAFAANFKFLLEKKIIQNTMR